ncbi:hypothetical protein PR002_g27022 [Phytophthora rubi]|nr:hypothetical protein PR002_g27022 [Phytophthora rubi]
MKSGGTRGDDSTAALITPQLELFAERTVSFDESMNGSDAKDEEMNEDYDDYLEEKAPAPAVVTPETPEDGVISAGCSGGTRSLSRNLTSELDEDALPVSRNLVDELDEVAGLEPVYKDFEDSTDDPKSPVTTAQVTEQTSGNRTPANGDTPAENLVLRRCYEVTKASVWGQKTTGEDWTRLHNGGVSNESADRSPYFQDSHMVTPQSTTRAGRPTRATENSGSKRGAKCSTGRVPFRRFQPDDASSDGDDGFTGDDGVQVGEYLWQIHEVTKSKLPNSTPWIEVTTHRPLGQIKALSSRRNKSETSMQWLRANVRSNDRRHDDLHCCDGRRQKDPRDGCICRDRRERDYERRRNDSRSLHRVALVDASVADIVAELQKRDARDPSVGHTNSRQLHYSDSYSEGASDYDSDGSDGLSVGIDPELPSLGHDRSLRIAADDSPGVVRASHSSVALPTDLGATRDSIEPTKDDEHGHSMPNTLTDRAPTTHAASGYAAKASVKSPEISRMSATSSRNMEEGDASNGEGATPTSSPTTCMDPHLPFFRLPYTYTGFVVSFGGSVNGDYGSSSWIVWHLPEWQIVIAASAYLEKTTCDIAEYGGLNNGVIAALQHGAEELVIVGDSKFTIRQSQGVMVDPEDSLATQRSRHNELTTRLRWVKCVPILREYNTAADSLATEALQAKVSKVVLNPSRKAELNDLNRIHEAIYESPSEGPDGQNPASGGSIQILDDDTSHKYKTCADPTRGEPRTILAVTHSQARFNEELVGCADNKSPWSATGESSANHGDHGQDGSAPKSRIEWISRIWPYIERGKWSGDYKDVISETQLSTSNQCTRHGLRLRMVKAGDAA